MPENFTDEIGDKALSWWYFEEATTPFLDGNTTNNNDAAWTASTSRDALHVQGSFSAKVTAETLSSPRVPFADLSSNFPYKAATTAYTIGGWVYFANYLTGANIFTWRNAGNTTGALYRTDGTTANKIVVDELGASTNITQAGTLAVGWHHLVIRWNGENRAGAGANDEWSFWIDGVKESTTRTIASVSLVADGDGFHYYAYAVENHQFDEWFAFDVALLDTQITDIYKYRLDGSAAPSTDFSQFPKPKIFEAAVRGEI